MGIPARLFATALALISILTSFSCRDFNSAETPDVSHVIIIGVDAMSPDGMRNAPTPILDSLMDNGAYTLNARGVLPTSSSTNWASMVSGAGPEQHGVTSNGWERDDYNFSAVRTGTEEIFPTIFGVSRQQQPDMEIGAIYTWEGFGRLIEKTALDFDFSGEDDLETIARAREYIQEKKPQLLFIHLDEVDHIGHDKGHKTTDFYQAVANVDSQIGEILQSARNAGIFEETVFIISADHGGIGYGHGGETLDELEIPFIISGKGVKEGYMLKNPVYTYDNAATVAALLGLQPPAAWIGTPVLAAFKGVEEAVVAGQKTLIPAPIIHPKPNLYDPAGGLYIDSLATVTMEASGNSEIRYTIDGSDPSRESELYSAPFKLDHSAVVQARAFAGEGQESNVSKAYFRLVDSKSNNGIRYAYYEGADWKFLPVFETLPTLKKGSTYEFRIGDINQRDNQYGIQFKSNLKIEKAGEYRFYLNSDDGSKLYINGELVVDNDGGHGTIERMGSIELQPGMHLITVDYHNQAGGAWLDVFYKGPGIPKQIIPADRLFLNP